MVRMHQQHSAADMGWPVKNMQATVDNDNHSDNMVHIKFIVVAVQLTFKKSYLQQIMKDSRLLASNY